jgi:FAD binding domain
VRDSALFAVIPSNLVLPRGNVLSVNESDRWLTVMPVGKEQDERPQPPSDTELVELIRPHAGIPGLDVQLINQAVWRMSCPVAAALRANQVFLVGDAAHRFPPTGGFALNTGVQDCHNLAWKLAFVLKGYASDKLLDTYDSERRLVAQSNADFSNRNRERLQKAIWVCRSGNEDEIAFWVNDLDAHLHSVGQALGFSYDSCGVIADGTSRDGYSSRYYSPTDQPGARFPHMCLEPTRQNSSLDWFDKDFTLVTGPIGDAWLEAGKRISERLQLPLRLRRLPSANPSDGIQMGLRGVTLVRPDGHVAWRRPWIPSQPKRELGNALNALLR